MINGANRLREWSAAQSLLEPVRRVRVVIERRHLPIAGAAIERDRFPLHYMLVRDIRVATVQFQHAPGDKAYNLGRVRHFVTEAARRGVEIIAFPEMCLTGYWRARPPMGAASTTPMSSLCRMGRGPCIASCTCSSIRTSAREIATPSSTRHTAAAWAC